MEAAGADDLLSGLLVFVVVVVAAHSLMVFLALVAAA